MDLSKVQLLYNLFTFSFSSSFVGCLQSFFGFAPNLRSATSPGVKLKILTPYPIPAAFSILAAYVAQLWNTKGIQANPLEYLILHNLGPNPKSFNPFLALSWYLRAGSIALLALSFVIFQVVLVAGLAHCP